MTTSLKPRIPRKPTKLQQGILYAAADLARFIVQVEDVAALLRRQAWPMPTARTWKKWTKSNCACCAMILACPCAASTDLPENDHEPKRTTCG